ncbi:MAG: YqeG family HAD IIIA-type phosphatase [Eubacteriales bacterium]
MKTAQNRFKKIFDITPKYFKDQNIKGMLVDMDNTLLPWHEDKLSSDAVTWLKTIENSGIKICIITNSRLQRTSTVIKDTNYDFIHTAFKPLPFSFVKGRKKLGVEKNEMCIVGDQMMTDALGAKIYGCRWIVVDPISPKEQKGTSINRFLERLIFRRDVRETFDEQ